LIDITGQSSGDVTTTVTDSPNGLTPVSIRPAEFDAGGLMSVALTSGIVQPESEPNNSRDTASPLAPASTILAGGFDGPSDVDWYRLSAAQPAALLITGRTRELGSPCDLVLSLHGADGGKLGESDDAGLRDAELAAQLPAAGDYFLKVTELAERGGPDWTYALDVFHGHKAVRITVQADRLNVPRRGSAGMVLSLQRIDYDGPLKVEATGLPASLQMPPFVVGAKQKDVPVILTAATAADASTDADWGPISFQVSSPDGSIPFAELQLAPPPPKKQDAEIFRPARLRADVFTSVTSAAQFNLTSEPSAVTVAQGASATVTVKAVRTAEWTEPIEIALATPADQLPSGITITGGSMTASELTVTITATVDATVGPLAVFLNGKSKKDAAEPVHPVPAIQVEVVAKAP
jgi:hypothetical protein